jgi:hypothetical protein
MRLVLLLALASAAAWCADFGGVWIGTDSDLAFELRQSGASLSGKRYADFGSQTFSGGIVSGDVFRFVIRQREQAGNDMQEQNVRYFGRRVGNEIELTVERDAARRNRVQTFRLKQLVR